MSIKKIYENQIEYYRDLFEKYKGLPMAVSSESIAHKELRFSKIISFIEKNKNISVHDIGMGVGSFYEYIKKIREFRNVEYSGSDIFEGYVKEARNKYPECLFYLRDITLEKVNENYDYVILSGVFHQRREIGIKEWTVFSRKLIKNAFEICKRGLIVNFVSNYVDYYQPNIYYCDLSRFIGFVEEELSRYFIVDHCCPLYEFTVFVCKEDYIREKYHQQEFVKYYIDKK